MKKISLKDGYAKALFIQGIQTLIVIGAFIGESLGQKQTLSLIFVLQMVMLVFILNFYFKALKSLQGTFWNISIIMTVFYIVSIVRTLLITNHPYVAGFYGLSLFLLFVNCYIISSPLYYPQVSWWEYDFRYRVDMPVTVLYKDEVIRARLTDLRRGAGCVLLFRHIPVGDIFYVVSDSLENSVKISALVKSKKEPIWGRAIVYGVKFNRGDKLDAQRLKLLSNHWRDMKKSRLKSKFSIGEESAST